MTLRSLPLAGAPVALLAFVVANGGCSYNWTYTPTDGGSGDGGSGSAIDRDGGTDARVTPDSGPAAPIACTSTAQCQDDEYCDFEGPCEGSPGKCAPRPTSCDGSKGFVCGCGGTVHESDCAAAIAGTDVTPKAEACATPAEMFLCGHYFCKVKFQYCVAFGDGEYQCKNYDVCTTGTCDCPEYKELGCTCVGDQYALTLTCP